MWTAENRPRYNRDTLRYPSDLSDEEWAHIEALVPPGKRGGGQRRVNLREVVNGVMYILSTGCQWRSLPKAQFVNGMRHLVMAAARQARSLAPGARPTRWNQLR